MLPQSYPNYKTVHCRFQQWCGQEVLRHILEELASELSEKASEKAGFSSAFILGFKDERTLAAWRETNTSLFQSPVE